MKRYSTPEYKQIDTPSNPDTGFNKIYLKSDKELYILDDDGTEHKAGSMSESDIKTAYENNANTNAYTDAEKAKLAQIDDAHFKGVFVDEASLPATGTVGDYAYVDGGVGNDILEYIWDDDDDKYVKVSGSSTAETAASIKTKYESNADTNAYTDAEKSKLGGIEAGAEENVQPDWNQTTTTADDYIANKPDIVTAGPIARDSTTGDDDYIISGTGLTSLIDGQTVVFQPDTNNTGAATINIDGLGAKSITKADGTALDDGTINAGDVIELIYDSINDRFYINDMHTPGVYKFGEQYLTESFIAGENIGANKVVQINTDNKLYLAATKMLGITMTSGLIGDTIKVVLLGIADTDNFFDFPIGVNVFYSLQEEIKQISGDGTNDIAETSVGLHGFGGHPSRYHKQTFGITSKLHNVELILSLAKTGTVSGNANVGIFKNSDNSEIIKTTFNVGVLTNSYVDYTIDLSGATLDDFSDEAYYICVEFNDGDDSNHIEWEKDSDTLFDGGTSWISNDQSSWTAINVDKKFTINFDYDKLRTDGGIFVGQAIETNKLIISSFVGRKTIRGTINRDQTVTLQNTLGSIPTSIKLELREGQRESSGILVGAVEKSCIYSDNGTGNSGTTESYVGYMLDNQVVGAHGKYNIENITETSFDLVGDSSDNNTTDFLITLIK